MATAHLVSVYRSHRSFLASHEVHAHQVQSTEICPGVKKPVEAIDLRVIVAPVGGWRTRFFVNEVT